ncbi:MAG TPA: hypothetical protein VJ767_11515 [Nitrososphaeraceae archaeon]|nr:hypothetical protein [Nitrososphaeraceae archaeon]
MCDSCLSGEATGGNEDLIFLGMEIEPNIGESPLIKLFENGIASFL